MSTKCGFVFFLGRGLASVIGWEAKDEGPKGNGKPHHALPFESSKDSSLHQDPLRYVTRIDENRLCFAGAKGRGRSLIHKVSQLFGTFSCWFLLELWPPD